MAFSDPIAEMLTKIRNAKNAKHRHTDLSLSKHKQSILQLLKDQGLIENFLVDEEKKRMRIFLKYVEGRRSVIHGLKRVSTPGQRKYISHTDIPSIYGGLGLVILSTPRGVMDGKRAKREKLGGEFLCCVW